jgi:hypothetical protein
VVREGLDASKADRRPIPSCCVESSNLWGYLDDTLVRTKELAAAMLVSCSTVTGNSICSLYSMRHFVELRPVKDYFSAVHIVWNVHASYEER